MPTNAIRAINKDLIKSSIALILTVVAVACILVIVVTTVTDNNPENDQHLILIFLLVGVIIARMYMCLPSSTITNRYIIEIFCKKLLLLNLFCIESTNTVQPLF